MPADQPVKRRSARTERASFRERRPVSRRTSSLSLSPKVHVCPPVATSMASVSRRQVSVRSCVVTRQCSGVSSKVPPAMEGLSWLCARSHARASSKAV